ncbi:glycoside hydrolase family 38 C-terminal domain-containing protein [Flavitalea sp. BT771]|uniref:glycoside hydrolase family 38 N-terminal domain-containing protein n=1 Tax=Flavitalea sp. BT771 TaxID=3063329 RepID=UPI0026E3F4B8|nr:glycoside hydrolase family 38 C-terminal domain-containing protein [Flavitalea sp. BT771]MDO6432202.1 glycoside hydrolase family 38 C-terminal domain-containing protein [Flavitalea sp. BT771]MDV6221112.1 glycoside hydrolase family 38 C-terminal domain-containing protein [Flavitalea sp. BT771]
MRPYIRKLLAAAVLVMAELGTFAQQAEVVYPHPMRYGMAGGMMQTKAVIVYRGEKDGLSAELYGKPLSFTADGDSLRVRLPLTGDKGRMVFRRGGRITLVQEFEPFVPSDWNYFANGTIDIISSSHQDIAWMNTPDSCRMERIEKIIVPAMHIMERDSAFRFGMEQTLNLMELIKQDPSYEEEAVRAYEHGQFGWGATFNQPYEGLESSEQLVRQLYLGRKWMKDYFNGRIDAHTAFNVDVPGRTPQLPQILARSGVRHLFISRFKEGFFNWYSPDGSKIFTYSPGNYGWAVMFYKYFDVDAPTAMHKLHEVLKNWNDYYASRHIPPHYAVVISNDASGPVYYDRVLKEWNHLAGQLALPIPRLRYTTADQFLDEVDVPEAHIDSISGERPDLWLYIHGPAHYEAIEAKRAAAIHLPASEMFNTIDGLLGGNFTNYPKAAFDSAWYKSIYPDHGWGGKHGDITDSIYRRSLEDGDSIALATLYPALRRIASRVGARRRDPVVVFNDLSWQRDAVVLLPAKGDPNACSVRDAEGRLIPSQPVTTPEGSRLAILAEGVPAIGYTTYYISKERKAAEASPTEAAVNGYENDFYRISFGDGGIKSLFDKELGQELLNTTRFAGGDVLDMGYDGLDAGEFTEITPTNMRDYDKLSNHRSQWSRVSDGPVFTTFGCKGVLGRDVLIQRITVYKHKKKIDFEYELPDWHGIRSRQLSFALPLNTLRAAIRYDVPMGMASVHGTELSMRPGGWAWDGTYRQKPEDIHPRESQNFVTAATDRFGITLASRMAVFDWIDPTRDAVSYPVLQAVMMTTQKSCHGEGPWYEQRGKHIFRLSISTHSPDWKKAFFFGMGSNHELYAVTAPTSGVATLPVRMSFFGSSAPGTLITAIKKADKGDGTILRIVNMDKAPQVNELHLFREITGLRRVNLIEEEEQVLSPRGSGINETIGGGRIETYSIDLKK